MLDAPAEALLLTIDGARRGLEGNISRAFARRWPEDLAEIEDQIRYPVPLGRTVPTRPDLDCPFKTVYVASTLHHLEVLTDAQKAGIVASALGEAVQMAMRHRMRTLASAVMTGGWRLPFDAALGAPLGCLGGLARPDAPLTFAIYVLGESELRSALTMATSRGFFPDAGDGVQYPTQHRASQAWGARSSMTSRKSAVSRRPRAKSSSQERGFGVRLMLLPSRQTSTSSATISRSRRNRTA